jgi:hypothetical protein
MIWIKAQAIYRSVLRQDWAVGPVPIGPTRLGEGWNMFVKIGMPLLTTGLLIVAGTISSFGQSQKDTSRQVSPEAVRTLLAAKTVLVVGAKAPVVQTTTKAEEALKSALVKWGRFHLVDDAGKADLVLVILELASSRSATKERIIEHLAIFAGGSMPSENATPLWEVEEVGPALGVTRKPTDKLVEHLRKDLTAFEKSAPPAAAPWSQIW